MMIFCLIFLQGFSPFFLDRFSFFISLFHFWFPLWKFFHDISRRSLRIHHEMEPPQSVHFPKPCCLQSRGILPGILPGIPPSVFSSPPPSLSLFISVSLSFHFSPFGRVSSDVGVFFPPLTLPPSLSFHSPAVQTDTHLYIFPWFFSNCNSPQQLVAIRVGEI